MHKVAIIDADSLLYFEMGKPTLEEAITGIDNRIHQILLETKCDKYIGFLTLGKCFRYQKAKTKPYKYNRKGGRKPPIFYALREYVQQKFGFTSYYTLEADDLVGLAREYWRGQWTAQHQLVAGETVICSPDKDVLNQVPGKHYNYQKAEFHITTHREAILFLWTQVLMGDPTDGIPGIPGVGPVKAKKALLNIPEAYNYPQIVLDTYLSTFGEVEGMERFHETYKLVKIHTEMKAALEDAGLGLIDAVTEGGLFNCFTLPSDLNKAEDLTGSSSQEEEDSWG